MPTRRAFLLLGGVLLGGLGSGACRYAASGADEKPKMPPSSGDAELDDLRRLALVAPIGELVADWPYFLDEFALSYRNDEYLPRGVARLIAFVEEDEDYPDRKLLAAVLAQVIQLGEKHLQQRFGAEVDTLKKIRH